MSRARSSTKPRGDAMINDFGMLDLQEPVALEVEVFVGSDRIVRVNLDGICRLRFRIEPGVAFHLTGAITLTKESH